MTVEHSTLTGVSLHENKGVAAASDNTVATASGSATVWQKLTATNLTGTGNPFGAQLLHVREEAVSGTACTTPTTGSTWNIRQLNTVKTNEISGASVASNQVTLPAGTYYMTGGAMSVYCIGNQVRFRNVTDNVTSVVGASSYQGNTNPSASTATSPLQGRFTLGGTKVLELQHWFNYGYAFASGLPVFSGEDEVFSEVLIWKIG